MELEGENCDSSKVNDIISVKQNDDNKFTNIDSKEETISLLETKECELNPAENDPSPETKVKVDDLDQDGGYGWVIVVCSSLVLVVFGANWTVFSVYITDFSEVFNLPQAQISTIGSLDAALSLFVALPSGAFISLCGCRVVCITGLLLNALGLFISAFVTDFYTFLVTFGVLKGTGAGMLYIPCTMIVQQYFSRRRALAAAFASGGMGLGVMVLSPVHRLLIEHYGWRGGLIVFSGVVIQCVLFAALMKPHKTKPGRVRSPSYRTEEPDTGAANQQGATEVSTKLEENEITQDVNRTYDESAVRIDGSGPVESGNKSVENTAQDTSERLLYEDVEQMEYLETGGKQVEDNSAMTGEQSEMKNLRTEAEQTGTTKSTSASCLDSLTLVGKHLRKTLTLSYMSDPKFVLFILAKPLVLVGIVCMHKFSVARAVNLGLGKITATFLVTCDGIGSTSSRYIGGLIVNSRNVNKLALYNSCYCAAGLVMMFYMLTGSEFYTHTVFQFLFGALTGAAGCISPTLAVDLFGIDRLPSTLGWILALSGTMTLASMPFYGWLYDVTSSYIPSYMFGGSIQVLAGGFGFIIMFLLRRNTNSTRQAETQVSCLYAMPQEKKLRSENTSV